MDEASLDVVARVLVKVLRPQLAVGLVACEHVVDGDEHGMADSDDRPTFATARRNATKLGRQVGVLRPAGDVGYLGQCAPQPRVATACPPTEASTAPLGIARAHPPPRTPLPATAAPPPIH